jgi:hypothetical protein
VEVVLVVVAVEVEVLRGSQEKVISSAACRRCEAALP